MLPDIISESTAVEYGQGITLPSLVGNTFEGFGLLSCKCITLKGGHYFEAPDSAKIVTANSHTCSVAQVSTGDLLLSPIESIPAQPYADLAYEFEHSDNSGKTLVSKGTFHPTEKQCELLGWLTRDGFGNIETQSLRFSNKDTWSLNHVQQLTESEFPGVNVKWYAKSHCFDITLTGGINNPLKNFIRQHAVVSGYPTKVSEYGFKQLYAFLRGLWGAEGWVSVRKGGADIDLGLSRTCNEPASSFLRMLHARVGIYGQRRNCPTIANPGKHRLIFSGYRNYATFKERVEQIAITNMPEAPARRPYQSQNVVRIEGKPFLALPVQRVVRLKEPRQCYRRIHA